MPVAIVVSEYGGPEVLRLAEVAPRPPAPGEVVVRHTAIGVNFHEVYTRTGLYKTLSLPGIPGGEAAGVIEAVGEGVTGFAVGDRVAYITSKYGTYAEQNTVAADLLVRIPSDIDDITAAAILAKGLTAYVLLHKVHVVQPGDVLLVHAAAGGVGQLLCQWASKKGAIVIGTAGSAEKADVAHACGCTEVIQYRREDIVERVRAITGGRGVDVAYDSVGKTTFHQSLECLAMFGHLVNFGQSSGAVEPFPVFSLAAKSNSLTRPIVNHYTAKPEELRRMASQVFGALTEGIIKACIGQKHPLREVQEAHRQLEAQTTIGSTVLIP